MAEHGDMITEPGFYDLDPRQYHADPCPEPSLSSGVARLLIDKSPAHARLAHPKLNPEWEMGDDAKFSTGSTVHQLLLGKGRDIVIIDAEDWRKKDVRTARDLAFGQGQIPILAGDYANTEKMANACREQLTDAGFGHVYSDSSQSETVMAWKDQGGIWCRAMLDWHCYEDGWLTIYDHKTTSGDAEPAALPRKLVEFGYEVQAAFYERGLQILKPEYAGRVRWRWIFQETRAPYSITIAEMAGDSRTIGAKKAAMACALWAKCLRSGKWPRWYPGVHRIEYPAWAEEQWLGRELGEFRDVTSFPMLEMPAQKLTPITDSV